MNGCPQGKFRFLLLSPGNGVTPQVCVQCRSYAMRMAGVAPEQKKRSPPGRARNRFNLIREEKERPNDQQV
jgi:hypothetical protein